MLEIKSNVFKTGSAKPFIFVSYSRTKKSGKSSNILPVSRSTVICKHQPKKKFVHDMNLVLRHQKYNKITTQIFCPVRFSFSFVKVYEIR